MEGKVSVEQLSRMHAGSELGGTAMCNSPEALGNDPSGLLTIG